MTTFTGVMFYEDISILLLKSTTE